MPAVSADNPTRVLRKTLESALETTMASTVLFEALGVTGAAVPETTDEVMSVVRGPLRSVLLNHLAPGDADLLIDRIEARLEATRKREDPQTLELPLDALVPDEPRSGDSTKSFPTAHRAVSVVVIAGSAAFAGRLRAALGSGRVAPIPTMGPETLMDVLGGDPPALIVVDAADISAISATSILSAAHTVPRTTACILWGADLPFGRSFALKIAAQDRPWVTLPLKEGIGPLLDLIKSRHRQKRTR